MSGTILRWGVPALVTVLAGTVAAVTTSGSAMTADLQTRASAALSGDFHWATVTIEGRDAVLSGTATDAAEVAAAAQHLAALRGLRSVENAVVLAEYVSPFPLQATVTAGNLSLSGGVPDETAHAELLLQSGASSDSLRLMSGAPERDKWLAASRYVIDIAGQLEEGRVELADLSVAVSGRARSAQAFDALQETLAAAPPDGVTLASVSVAPPLVTPYRWAAAFDGRQVSISGYMPEPDFAERLMIADIGGRPVSTSLQLASGEPTGFEDKAVLLLQNLMQLEYGEVAILDGELTLSGAPADADTANRIRLALEGVGAKIALEPRRVAAYAIEVKPAGDTLILSGFVPDDATRKRLQALGNVDLSAVELGRGAPERFLSGVDFAIELARRMSEGSVRLEGTALTIAGRATTLADFNSLTQDIRRGAPQGLILKSVDLLPPLAAPFTWTATKSASGDLVLAGYVPDEATQTALRKLAPGNEDKSVIADGEPQDFSRLAAEALSLLTRLESGTVTYDGASWKFEGKALSQQAEYDVRKAFDAAGLRAAGWSYAVEAPKPPAPAPLPVIDPYTWRAQKSADGTVTFTGFLPTPQLKSVLAIRVGAGLRDRAALGAGAPNAFIPEALAGIDALLALTEGTLEFANSRWSLRGDVATASARSRLEGALTAAVDETAWTIEVKAADAPIVSPFTWAAVKSADGSIALSGYATTDELKKFIAVRAGKVQSDTTEIASGEPAGFMADVLAGLEALSHLKSGSVRFDGTAFSLVGVPASEAERDAALAALDAATGAGAGWRKELAAPEPEVAVVPPETPQPVEKPVEKEVVPAPEPEPEQKLAVAPPSFGPAIFEAAKPRGGAVTLSGQVPADAARRYFATIAGGVPADGMSISSDLPEGFIDAATAGIRTLASLDGGSLAFDGKSWQFKGIAVDEPAREAALAALGAVPAARDWQTEIGLVPPLELCQERVDAFAARNAILFQSGSATITDESQGALDELAGYLKACPEATIHVEGHTDADGEEQLNLALSVMRAEAVVASLIARGVADQRLYAVGYGESLPIADNDSRAGKQANRRIAFTILDEHN